MTENHDQLPSLVFHDEDDARENEPTERLDPEKALKEAGLGLRGDPCFLVLRGAQSAGRIIPLSDQMVIGRSVAADAQLVDSGVSRQHIKVTLNEGRIAVEDLGSANGLVVRGQRCKQAELREGEKVVLGDVALTLVRLTGYEERLAAERERATLVDVATRLPSRLGMLNRIHHELELADEEEPLALCLLYFDQYDEIIDTAGVDAGHQVMREAAQILANLIQREERSIGRLSDSELGLLLPQTTRAQAEQSVEPIVRAVLAHPFVVGGHKTRVVGTVGIATSEDATTAAGLLRVARRDAFRRALGGRRKRPGNTR